MAVIPSKAITSAGTKIYICTNLPSSYDAAGFGALSWTEIAEASSLGSFGGTRTVVNHIPVGTSTVVKRSGSVNFGTMTVDLAYHTGADMTIVNSVFSSGQPAAFKIVFPSALGQTAYFSAIVSAAPVNISTADSILMSNLSVDVDNEIIFV